MKIPFSISFGDTGNYGRDRLAWSVLPVYWLILHSSLPTVHRSSRTVLVMNHSFSESFTLTQCFASLIPHTPRHISSFMPPSLCCHSAPAAYHHQDPAGQRPPPSARDVTSRRQVFFYIVQRQIAGCLVAERVSRAFPMLPRASSSSSDPEARPSGVRCSTAAQPCRAGVSRVWVHRDHRRQRLATRLVLAMK